MGSRDVGFDSGEPEPQTTVYIGNLPSDSIQGDVEHIFSECRVKSIRMVRDRETDAFRGFAYVEFEDPSYVKKALKLNGAIYDGRELKIDIAQNRRNTNRGRRGGAGGPPGYGGRGGGGGGVGGGSVGGGGVGGGRGGYYDAARPSNRGGYHDYAGGGRGGRGGVGGAGGGGGGGAGGFPAGGRRQRQGSGGSGHKDDMPADDPPPGRPKLKLLPRTVKQSEDAQQQRNQSIFGSGKPRPPTPPSGDGEQQQ